MLLGKRATKEFDVEVISSAAVDEMIAKCARLYAGSPDWVNVVDHIKTVNFAKALCSETARLATLGIGITIDGSARAMWLQEQIDSVYYQLRHWVEYGCAYGTIILKPNGETVEMYTRGSFEITHQTGGVIDGVIFLNQKQVGKKWYTRLEYHRFADDLYAITNRCFVGDSKDDTNKQISIEQTPWADLAEEAFIANVDKPLFGVLRTPHANNLCTDSPYALPIFSDAIEELKDLDIAYSRNAKEIQDSKRTVLADDNMIAFAGEKVAKSAQAVQHKAVQLGMPDMVKMVKGDGRETYYQEINPELNTDTRLTGINALLSQIGYKVGYSNGYFVFNESSGIQTATGVEAEQQRTIQFIKDVRDKLESCLDGLIYALNAFADLYDLAPTGAYEAVYDFGDITYDREQDRARWWSYVTAGKVPAWMFFVKFEGMTEKDAKAMVAEAAPKTTSLFDPEE